MKKILFLIHDLGHGGAEKVLVNLVNNMDTEKFDITVMALFGGGVNEQFLKPHIRYQTVFKKVFPANSRVMKFFSPRRLHELFIKERYDIEVSYLEGPSARIISGCPDSDTKLVNWIHCTMHSEKEFAIGFRSVQEAQLCYSRFHGNAFVSQEVMDAFQTYCPVQNAAVLYNTNDSDKILSLASEPVQDAVFDTDAIRLIGIGKIEKVKGFDRLARVHKRLIQDGYPVHTYLLGEGSQASDIRAYLEAENLTDSFTLLGYQTNPYKYLAASDLFVCSSYSEGFSTAATEALIVGTPVVTTLVSGMREMLGENNAFGVITENDEDALYRGIVGLLENPERLSHYKEQALTLGKAFSAESTTKDAESYLYLL